MTTMSGRMRMANNKIAETERMQKVCDIIEITCRVWQTLGSCRLQPWEKDAIKERRSGMSQAKVWNQEEERSRTVELVFQDV